MIVNEFGRMESVPQRGSVWLGSPNHGVLAFADPNHTLPRYGTDLIGTQSY